jgi:hypothetical protein
MGGKDVPARGRRPIIDAIQQACGPPADQGQSIGFCQGFVDAVRDHVAAAPLKHLDETGFRIGGKTQWLHIASTVLLTFYRISPKRGTNSAPPAKTKISCRQACSSRHRDLGGEHVGQKTEEDQRHSGGWHGTSTQDGQLRPPARPMS